MSTMDWILVAVQGLVVYTHRILALCARDRHVNAHEVKRRAVAARDVHCHRQRMFS